MRCRKTFKVSVALLVFLGVFTNTSLSEICFCGQACMHGLQPKAKIKANLLFHMRCLDTRCKSCDLEKGQTLKATSSKTKVPNINILGSLSFLSISIDYPYTYNTLNDFDPSYACETFPSSPIYLQKHSLLC